MGHRLWSDLDRKNAVSAFAELDAKVRSTAKSAAGNKRDRYQKHVDGINAMRFAAEKDRDDWKRKAEALASQLGCDTDGERVSAATLNVERAARLAVGRAMEGVINAREKLMSDYEKELATERAARVAAEGALAAMREKLRYALSYADSNLSCATDASNNGQGGMWCFTRAALATTLGPCDCDNCATWRALRGAGDMLDSPDAGAKGEVR